MGEGGVGTVFRAWDNQIGRAVALKRFKSRDAVEATWKEIQILVSLHHPNIVTVYDAGQDEDGAFIVMELIEGYTLDQIIAEYKTLPVPMFLDFADQCLRGLSAAHGRSVIHRDIKPSNIMLVYHPDQSFTVKVLDFGQAKEIEAPSEQTLDQDQNVVGSIYTMSPEQLTRKPLDHRTDIYSLGCVFYYALAGRYPYIGDSMTEIGHGHLGGNPQLLSQFRNDVPKPIEAVVRRMMSRKPEDRFENLDEVRRALSSQASLFNSGLVATTLPWRSLTLAGVVCLLLAAGGVWWWYGSADSSPHGSPASGSAATPSSIPAPTVLSPERPQGVLDPLDLEAARACLGKEITVEGRVADYGQSKSGTMRYLNFDNDFHRSISLVFRVTENEMIFTTEYLQSHVGKTVRATGVMSEYQGRLQMKISDPKQVHKLISP